MTQRVLHTFIGIVSYKHSRWSDFFATLGVKYSSVISVHPLWNKGTCKFVRATQHSAVRELFSLTMQNGWMNRGEIRFFYSFWRNYIFWQLTAGLLMCRFKSSSLPGIPVTRSDVEIRVCFTLKAACLRLGQNDFKANQTPALWCCKVVSALIA